MYILLLALTSKALFALENETTTEMEQEISVPQAQELKNEVEIDLNKLETDLQQAAQYHAQEKEFEAMEEEKAKEAVALLELIEQQAKQEEELIPAPQLTETQVTQEDSSIATIANELDTLSATQEEILQEPALQDEVQEAQEIAENIELS